MEEEKIYIIGHKNPDTDSICSAVAYAYLKNKEENTKKYIPARSGKINPETNFIFKYFDFTVLPHLMEDATGKKVILVDHTEPKQRPENMDKGEIVEVIDHHNISFQQAKPIFFHVEPIGSTSTIITKMYFDKNIEIPKKIAGLLISAIVSDTVIFKSPITTEEDRKIAEKLMPLAGIDNMDSFGIEMFKAKSNWGKKTADEIINTDYKEYELAGKNIGIAQIETVDASELEKRKQEFLEVMKKMKTSRNLDLIIVLLTDIIKEGCLAFLVGDEIETVEKAFNNEIKDNQMYLPGVLSRKKQVVPVLEDLF